MASTETEHYYLTKQRSINHAWQCYTETKLSITRIYQSWLDANHSLMFWSICHSLLRLVPFELKPLGLTDVSALLFMAFTAISPPTSNIYLTTSFHMSSSVFWLICQNYVRWSS